MRGNCLLKTVASLILGISCLGYSSLVGAQATQLNTSALEQKTEQIVSSLSDKEKIGQLMFVGLSGTKLSKSDKRFLEKIHVGGVILFDRNMDNPEQVTALNSEVQRLGTLEAHDNSKTKLPVFIAVDQEGGRVVRMRDKWPDVKIPAAEELGATNKPEVAKTWAGKVAKSMKQMGFNVNFAPVADVGANRGRSFAKDSAKVTTFVDAVMEGYAQEKVMATLKHFPGIGRAVVDPHLDGSVIKEDLELLEKTDLVPFKNAIQNRDNNTFMVMISHLSYTSINKDMPSSLSPEIINGLLKEKSGFKGIAVTDSLEMGAVTKHYKIKEAGVQAVMAGADMALVCHKAKDMRHIYQGLLKAYQKGTLSRERVEDCLKRIVRAKLVNLES